MLSVKRKRELFIAAVALPLLAVYAARLIQSQDELKSYPVDAYAGQHHFQIPRNYLAFSPKYNQKDIAAVLEVLWPAFEPKTNRNTQAFDPMTGRRLYMIIDKEPALVEPFNPYDPFSAYRNVVSNDEVLKKYEEQGLRNMEYLGSRSGDYFVTKDRRFFTSCIGILSKMPNPGCTAQINVLVDLKIFVRFSSKYIDDFPMMVRRIEDFLQAHEIVEKEPSGRPCGLSRARDRRGINRQENPPPPG